MQKSLQWIIDLENLQLTFTTQLWKDTVNNLSSQYIYISHNIVGKQYYKILDIDIMSMLYTVVEKTSKIYSNKNDICIKNIGTWNISYLINLIYFYFIFCLDWNKNFVFKSIALLLWWRFLIFFFLLYV